MRAFCILCTLLFSGCGTAGLIEAPPAWCTAASSRSQPLNSGDDLIQKHADLKEAEARERSKNRCLRKYVRAVTG
jgi:hypothetical protein